MKGGKPKPKKNTVKCPDCGCSYKIGMPHAMFCLAHTCDECGDSHSYVIPVYDSWVKPPIRLCDDCLNERLNAEEEEDDG
jgi:hypothetical protein